MEYGARVWSVSLYSRSILHTYFLIDFYFFMFDFEKLTVYQKAKVFDQNVLALAFSNSSIDKVIASQLKRASLSIPLNIAEGTGRSTKADRKNFYVIARGSAFECVAIFDILRERKNISSDKYSDFYKKSEELSMMLFAMIKHLSK